MKHPIFWSKSLISFMPWFLIIGESFSSISIKFKLRKGYPSKQPTFQQNPMQWLLYEHDRKVQDTIHRIE